MGLHEKHDLLLRIPIDNILSLASTSARQDSWSVEAQKIAILHDHNNMNLQKIYMMEPSNILLRICGSFEQDLQALLHCNCFVTIAMLTQNQYHLRNKSEIGIGAIAVNIHLLALMEVYFAKKSLHQEEAILYYFRQYIL